MTFMPEEQDIVTEDEQDDTTEGSQEVSVDTLTAQKRIALQQRNEEREINKKLQERIQELEKLVPSKTTETKPIQQEQSFATKDELEPLKFAVAHKDYGDEEMTKLVVLAKAYGSLEEANKSEEFQFWREKKLAERQSADAIPSQNRSGRIKIEEIPKPTKDREAHKKWVMEQS